MQPSTERAIPSTSRLGILSEIAAYYPSFATYLQRAFCLNLLRAEVGSFGNDMPLYLLGEAHQTLLLSWINGDSWRTSVTDLQMAAHALTFAADPAGRNTERLGIFAPFIDGRQDARSTKPVALSGYQEPNRYPVVVVKSQFVFTEVLAQTLATCGVDYLATIDFHSYKAVAAFEKAGIEMITLSAMRLFSDKIKEVITEAELGEAVVCTTDIGDLNRAVPLANLLGVDLAIINKLRIPNEAGTDSTISQQLVFGDVAGKIVILPDDMISSAKTTQQAVELLIKMGAKKVIFCATHPVFVGDYYARMQQILERPEVLQIVVTNALPLRNERRKKADIPYIKGGLDKKSVTVLDIRPTVLNWIKSLLLSESLEEARSALSRDLIEYQDPHQYFQHLTGNALPQPEIVGVYEEGGEITILDWVIAP